MEEIRKGIYRYAGELEKPSDRPLILVHPWYISDCPKRVLDSTISADYDLNLEILLSGSGQRNIVLFSERIGIDGFAFGSDKDILEGWCDKISRYRDNDDGIYAVRTRLDNPEPVIGRWSVGSWGKAAKFIRNFSKEVDVAGGYLRGGNGLGYRGCLGITINKLSERGIKTSPILDCCFT